MSTLKTTYIQHPSATNPAIELDPVDGVVFSAASLDAAVITSGVLDAARVPLAAGIGSNVVQAVKTDTFSTSSTSFTDVTGLAVTITPSSDTSKVLVIGQVSTGNPNNESVFVGLVRGSTNLMRSTTATNNATFAHVDSSNFTLRTQTFVFLDSPAADVATTYKVQMRVSAGTGQINRRASDNSLGATSSITVIEVAV